MQKLSLVCTPLLPISLAKYSPLVQTKLVEGKIMVDISEDKLLKKGDVIKTINGKTTGELTNQKLLYAVGANHKAKMNDMGNTILEELSKKDIRIADTLTIGRYNQKDTIVVLKTQADVFLMKPKKEQSFNRNLSNNICYIDVCDRSFSMKKAKEFIIANKEAKGFIFDVRGYPNIPSDELLAFFSTKSLEGLEMVTPVIISPIIANDTTSNIEINKYKIENIQSKAKVVCLSSADTYSYPETWLGTVKKNKIGIIIGEATAGTNGDIVLVKNTKIFGLSFTGLIVKMNGQRTHGIGILPDIEVSPTIEGIREGKDEVLEKAIEYLNNQK
jgi:C-terminal processing protease CtpA/Prc